MNMVDRIDYYLANSEQIEADICKKLENIRLARNITQAILADQAGVSLRTIRRLEHGLGVSLDTFIRVLTALGVQQNLGTFLPDPSIRPIDRVNLGGSERKRASSRKKTTDKAPWVWGDEPEGKS
jgi:transcriptional regulator with XRE-family HTH domain